MFLIEGFFPPALSTQFYMVTCIFQFQFLKPNSVDRHVLHVVYGPPVQSQGTISTFTDRKSLKCHRDRAE